jgi:hypothetical protein
LGFDSERDDEGCMTYIIHILDRNKVKSRHTIDKSGTNLWNIRDAT